MVKDESPSARENILQSSSSIRIYITQRIISGCIQRYWGQNQRIRSINSTKGNFLTKVTVVKQAIMGV